MENFYLYILITIMMVVMPGADTALVTKNTLAHGKRGGRATVFGIGTGLIVHTMAAVLGLSAIIAKSVLLFEIIKYAGAIYLFYLGITALTSKNKQGFETSITNPESRDTTVVQEKNKSCFLQGVMTNILNPKSVVFYMTFLPQFIDPHENVFLQLVLLASILIVCALLWFLFFVYILDHIRTWFKKPTFQTVFQRVTGLMLISLGVKLVFEKR